MTEHEELYQKFLAAKAELDAVLSQMVDAGLAKVVSSDSLYPDTVYYEVPEIAWYVVSDNEELINEIDKVQLDTYDGVLYASKPANERVLSHLAVNTSVNDEVPPRGCTILLKSAPGYVKEW